MQGDLTSHLLAHGALTELIGTRLAWGVMPQGDQGRPYLVLTAIDAPGLYHSRGASALRNARVQADVYADSAAGALAVADILRAFLDVTPGVVGTTDFRGIFYDGGGEMPDETAKGEATLFRRRADFIIHYKESGQ